MNDCQTLDFNNLCYQHVVLANPMIYAALVMLFNAMLKHGNVPIGFGSSILLSTPKDKSRGHNDITNYRLISILPVIVKVFERCIEKFLDKYLVFHPNQYGFVCDGGCDKAIFAFSRIVAYFTDNGGNVFIFSLDVCKAFDRTNHFALFASMLHRGIPKPIVNIFISWYRNLSCQVRWANDIFYSFLILSGLPQGSLLSPKFYNINSNGCRITSFARLRV